MDIQKAIQEFILAHEVDNCSPYTLRNCRLPLVRFAEWLQSEHGVTDTEGLQVIHLRGWMSHLQKAPSRRGTPFADSTIHQYGQVLASFCRWLEQEEVLEKPITPRFKLPRVEEKFIPTFTPEDVEKLLAACVVDASRFRPATRRALTARNRAIVSVLLDTGIRRQELVSLRLGDIDRDLRVLLVHRKGNRWQQVPISYDGFKPLHEYLSKYRPYLAKLAGRTVARKDDAVFLADDGEPLTIEGVSQLFIRLRKRTGIEGKRVAPHNCRRYMATTQLASGRSPLDVQRQMGHTTLMMTNRYASLNVEQLRRSHELHSPLRARGIGESRPFGSGYWEE
jgi:site-specific recombinase XerD